MKKISEFIDWGRSELAGAAIQCHDPSLQMRQIIAEVLGWPMTRLYTALDYEITDPELISRIRRYVARRAAGEPFQYIVGHETFWESSFKVGPGVLIPRPETEHIVEYLVGIRSASARVAELGPGSGNIGLSVLHERSDARNWQWFGFELNPESIPYLEINRRNILGEALSAQYQIVVGDFFARAAEFGPYDFVVSNPPYIGQAEFPELPLEVTHEPRMALFGGERGDELIGCLIDWSKINLKDSGTIVLEIGWKQGPAILEKLEAAKFRDCRILKDYAGRDRIAIGNKKGI